MTPLLSVMIPSRWRFEKLRQSVWSWFDNSLSFENFEVLVRLHSTDTESVSRAHELSACGSNVKIFTGKDKPAGAFNNWLWNELVPHATGKWHQYWSDDMKLFGTQKWDALLPEIPMTGVIVHPEIHKLGGSTYLNHVGGPVPFVPADCLKRYGHDFVLDPPDTFLDQTLRVRHKWQTRFLKGVGVYHDRDETDRTLTEI